MLKEFYNKNKQHIIIIALFLVVSIAYCYPILSGKKMNQNDDFSANALNVEAEKYYEKTGEFIGWTNSMFSGMPTSVGSNGPGNYSVNLIYAFAEKFDGFSFDVIFWCLIGMYILFCAMGINPWLGALGSFIFAFSSFNMLSLEAGHVQKIFNIALMPLLMGGIYLIFQKKYIWGFIATAFGVNYQIGMGHYQITYYAAIAAVVMCLFYGIYCLVKQENQLLLKAIPLLLVAVIFGALPNLTVLNTYYASHETTRGGASELTAPSAGETNSTDKKKDGLDFNYATQWSYGIPESFTFLVPNALGGDGQNLAYEFDKRGQPKPKKDSETFKALQNNVTDNTQYGQLANAAQSYWGKQPFVGGPIYFGAIVCFLAIFGLIASQKIEKWWILALTVLFLLLAWGNNSIVYKFFFDYVPVFNKFRTPSMALSVVQMGFSLLAILGLIEIFKAENKERLVKPFLYTGLGFGVLLLLMIIAPTSLFSFESANDASRGLPDWLISAMVDDRAALMTKDAIRSLLFIAGAFAILFLHLKGSLKQASTAIIIVALLIVGDLWNFNQRYINKEDFITPSAKKSMIAPSPVDQQIMQDPTHFRVFNLAAGNPFSDWKTSYHHHSIGGYHGAKLRKYQELIENQINTMNPSVLSMLNTKYLIVDGGQGPTIQRPIKDPMGNAWFVSNVKVVENGDQEMAALNVDSTNVFEPAQTLVVQKKNLPEDWNGFTPSPDPSASIQLIDYAPHRLKYESNAAKDQVAVFSEIYYEQPDGDGWKAFIDGQPAEHFRGNYVLRAMKVPAGKHLIEFKYDASETRTRGIISFTFMILLIIISGALIYLKSKGKLNKFENTDIQKA